MSKTNLGRVSVCPKGTYSTATSYKRLDVVNYGSGSWMALQDCTGVEPADGAYWMNLVSITKDSVVDALGYTPEKKIGNYELITSFTYTETVSVVTFNKDSSGNDFSLTALKTMIHFPIGQTGGGTCYCSCFYSRQPSRYQIGDANINASAYVTKQDTTVSSHKSTITFAIEPVNGLWTAVGKTGGQGGFMTPYYTANGGNLLKKVTDTIKFIAIYCSTAIVGTTIDIYGVRA